MIVILRRDWVQGQPVTAHANYYMINRRVSLCLQRPFLFKVHRNNFVTHTSKMHSWESQFLRIVCLPNVIAQSSLSTSNWSIFDNNMPLSGQYQTRVYCSPNQHLALKHNAVECMNMCGGCCTCHWVCSPMSQECTFVMRIGNKCQSEFY